MSFVKQLIKDGVLKNPLLIEAFEAMKREDFLPAEYRDLADNLEAIPIGCDQTNPNPVAMAMMLEWLDPRPGERVLDIGFGSGWQTAIIASIVSRKEGGKVVGIERVPILGDFGLANIRRRKQMNHKIIKYILGDGAMGYVSMAPYNKIIAGGSLSAIPQSLQRQLVKGGRIVAAVGTRAEQKALVVDKISEDDFRVAEHPGFNLESLITDLI